MAGTYPARNARPWRFRAAGTALILAPVALFSSAFSLAVATDTRQPAISQQLYSSLPRAKTRLGDLALARALAQNAQSGPESAATVAASAINAGLNPRTRLSIEARALSSLADTALSPEALRQLAFVAEDEERRATLLDLARRVSRRDVAAAAQSAELAFARGDHDRGFAVLDQALAISSRLDDSIFPLLLRSSRDRDFARLVRASLSADPQWAERLAAHASNDSESAALFAPLAGALAPRSRALLVDYGAPLIERLTESHRYEEAFAAYRAYARGPQDPAAFGSQPLAPIDWQLVDQFDHGARRIGSAPGSVELFARARREGDAARIVLARRPGSHVLNLKLSEPRGSGGSLALTRTCLSRAGDGASEITRAALEADQVALRFTVPDGCPYQSLRLAIQSEREAISVLVDDVAIERSAVSGEGQL
ncbi:hypothetical protein [Qipengyuania nanhaisediminis]|uniref:hypothetical protein n=1 Tax=Qipengyuania nanhaisediminis TaxID=604088 RepID=UPI0038B25B89